MGYPLGYLATLQVQLEGENQVLSTLAFYQACVLCVSPVLITLGPWCLHLLVCVCLCVHVRYVLSVCLSVYLTTAGSNTYQCIHMLFIATRDTCAFNGRGVIAIVLAGAYHCRLLLFLWKRMKSYIKDVPQPGPGGGVFVQGSHP